MKIKQQKQVKAFLIKEFGKDRGSALFNRQEEMLNILIKNTQNKSTNQMKTLIQVILPGIALFKILSKEEIPEEDVYEYMQKYLFDEVGAKMHSSMAKMELIPGFYAFYSFILLRV